MLTKHFLGMEYKKISLFLYHDNMESMKPYIIKNATECCNFADFFDYLAAHNVEIIPEMPTFSIGNLRKRRITKKILQLSKEKKCAFKAEHFNLFMNEIYNRVTD